MKPRSITSRIDVVTLVTKDKLIPFPPAPRSVKIEVTSGCNLRCLFCTLKDREEQPTKPMNKTLRRRIFQEMHAAGVKEIGLFYISEPFFQTETLIEAIKEAKEIGFEYVFLTTNGVLATPERVKRAMEAGLNSLKFSINFSDDEQYERITQKPAKNYHRALENLKAAYKIRNEGNYDCGVFVSSIQFDGEQAQRMEKLISDHVMGNCDEHYLLPLYSFGGAKIDKVGKPIAGNQGRIGALRDGLPCWSLWEGHIRASLDGERAYLSFCCFGSDSTFDVADLSEVSFMDAWHSEKFAELRKAHIAKDVTSTACANCVAYA